MVRVPPPGSIAPLYCAESGQLNKGAAPGSLHGQEVIQEEYPAAHREAVRFESHPALQWLDLAIRDFSPCMTAGKTAPARGLSHGPGQTSKTGGVPSAAEENQLYSASTDDASPSWSESKRLGISQKHICFPIYSEHPHWAHQNHQ